MIKVGGDYNDTGMDQIFKTNWRGVFVFNYPTADLAKAAFLAGKWTQYVEFVGLNGNTVDQAGRFNARPEGARLLRPGPVVRHLVADDHGGPEVRASRQSRTTRFSTRRRSSCRARRTSSPTCRSRTRTTSGRRACRSRGRPRRTRRASCASPSAATGAARRNPLLPALLEQRRRRGDLPGERERRSGRRPDSPLPDGARPSTRTPIQQLGSLPPGTSFGAVGVWTIASDFRNPHTDRISLGAERELFGIAWGLEGIWAKGYDLERLNDANLLAGAGRELPGARPEFRLALLRRLADFRRTEPDQPELRPRHGLHVGRAFGLQVRRRCTSGRNFAAGFRFFGSLTRASDYDTDSNERNFLGFTLWDVNNPELNWGPSDRDIRWRGVANASYERRFGSVDAFSSVLFSYQTGRPLQRVHERDANKDGISTDRATIDGVVVGPQCLPPARLLHGGRALRRSAFGSAPARSRCSSTSSTSRTRATARRP